MGRKDDGLNKKQKAVEQLNERFDRWYEGGKKDHELYIKVLMQSQEVAGAVAHRKASTSDTLRSSLDDLTAVLCAAIPQIMDKYSKDTSKRRVNPRTLTVSSNSAKYLSYLIQQLGFEVTRYRRRYYSLFAYPSHIYEILESIQTYCSRHPDSPKFGTPELYQEVRKVIKVKKDGTPTLTLSMYTNAFKLYSVTHGVTSMDEPAATKVDQAPKQMSNATSRTVATDITGKPLFTNQDDDPALTEWLEEKRLVIEKFLTAFKNNTSHTELAGILGCQPGEVVEYYLLLNEHFGDS